MNILQKLMNYLFSWQYVLLICGDQENMLRRAVKMGEKWYAIPYLPDTRAQLLPGGKVSGKSYVIRWDPVTDLVKDYYNLTQD